MLNLITCALFALCPEPAQEPVLKDAVDSQKELVALTTKISKAKSYEFTLKSESSGGGFGGRDREGAGRGGGEAGGGEGRGGGEAGGGEERPARRQQREPTVTKGAFRSDLPMQLTVGETVAYKDLDQVVYQNEEGEWALFDREAMRGGRGARGRGGEGGGERGERGAARGFGGFNRALFSVIRVTAPHETLVGFDKKIEKVEVKGGEDGLVIFTGTLTEEAAGTITGRGMRMFGGMRGGRGGGDEGPQFDTAGTFTIQAKNGVITSAVFNVTISGFMRDREFERTTTRTLTFAKVGKAEYEVPEAALALFEI